MNFVMPNFSIAFPEIFILVMTSIILLIDVFITERFRVVSYTLAQISLAITFLLTGWQFLTVTQPIVTFSGHFILDKLAIMTKLFVILATIFAFVYARAYNKSRPVQQGGDFYLLGLFAVIGMQVMASAYSLLTIYLGLELLSLSLYAMVALHKHSQYAVEAAMKYFIMGAMASGFLLYGISLLYGVTGKLSMTEIADSLMSLSTQFDPAIILGLIFVIAGLMFKFGAVPFHMWVPDVYDGAPTTMTLFIASAPKVAAFCITMRILVEALPHFNAQWQMILVVIAVLSMFGGNLLAIAQTNIKRMLAYSSIAHIGYMLLGIIAGPNSSQGYSAAMFYIGTYVIMAAGAFAVITLLSKQGEEFELLEDFRGLNARSPWMAFMMLLLMFSLAGVPPTVGFFAKLGLLEALVQAHYVWLAVLALVFAIIGAYYYLRIVMLMYFEEPRESLAGSTIKLSKLSFAAITVNGAAALVLGLFPSMLIDMCRISVS